MLGFSSTVQRLALSLFGVVFAICATAPDRASAQASTSQTGLMATQYLGPADRGSPVLGSSSTFAAPTTWTAPTTQAATPVAQATPPAAAAPVYPTSPTGFAPSFGPQVAQASLPGRPWFADRPDYFNPFDFQWNDGRSWVNVYAGLIGKAELSSILFTGDFSTGDVGIVAASYAREFGSLGNALRFEWEVGGSFHFGAETFVSGHAYLVARWIWFPWNKWLMTTFAVGTGPSIASKKSKYEAESGEASYYKNGFMMEFTFGLPEVPDWALQARIHHRSSIFGVLAKAGSPSDYLTLGLKYRF